MKNQEDTIMELLKSGFHTINDVAAQTGTSYSMVWKVLNTLRDKPFIVIRQKDTKDRRKIYIKVVENPSAIPIPEKRNLVNLDVSDVELIGADKK
jgi:DNA-binding MarR family transcriptional regulator